MSVNQEPPFKSRYGNYIGGEWKAPVKGEYMKNISPVDGRTLCEVPQSTAEDVELALDAAHKAFKGWARTSITDRSEPAGCMNRMTVTECRTVPRPHCHHKNL